MIMLLMFHAWAALVLAWVDIERLRADARTRLYSAGDGHRAGGPVNEESRHALLVSASGRGRSHHSMPLGCDISGEKEGRCWHQLFHACSIITPVRKAGLVLVPTNQDAGGGSIALYDRWCDVVYSLHKLCNTPLPPDGNDHTAGVSFTIFPLPTMSFKEGIWRLCQSLKHQVYP